MLTCCNAKTNIKPKEENHFEYCLTTSKKNISKSKSFEKNNQYSRQSSKDQ